MSSVNSGKSAIVENIHRDSFLDSLIGETLEIQFTDGNVVTGRLEWVESTSQGFKPHMYALVTAAGGISFYKTHVKRINKRRVR